MCVLGNYFQTAENPTVSDLRDERMWQPMGFISNVTSAGVSVTPDNAKTVSAYFDGIRIISEDIAKLPLRTFRRLRPRGREEAVDHPVYALLMRSPNDNMASMAFREAMTANAISWGGGYAIIERNGSGEATRLDIVHPSRVRVDVDRQGRTFYEIGIERTNEVIRTMIVRQVDMFHLHGLSDDGVNGYSVARLGAESLGRAMAQDRFSSSFFRSGSSPKGAIRFAKKFNNREEIERLRAQWQETYGGERGWHKPIILEQGAEWKTITIPPEEAQMIESQKFSVRDIARWLRIAPHKLGDLEDATFSNIEQQTIDHVNDTLMPWMVRWEEEITRKLLIGEEQDVFSKHDVEELLRGDSEARSQFLREMFNIGAMSQNDVRDRLDLNPIGPEGDVYYIQGQMIRSEDAAEGTTNASDEPPAGRIDGFDNEPQQPEQQLELFAEIIQQALVKCDLKEKLAIGKAAKKHGGTSTDAFIAWFREFHEGHERYVYDAVSPVIATVGKLAKKSFSLELVRQFAVQYVGLGTLWKDSEMNRDSSRKVMILRLLQGELSK